MPPAELVARLKALLDDELLPKSLADEIARLIVDIETGETPPGFTMDDVRRAADVWENAYPDETYDRLIQRAAALEKGVTPMLARAVRVELSRRKAGRK